MPNKQAPASGLVHLYPDPYHFVLGESVAERDVTPEEAERLLAYSPPAYHLERPTLVGPLTRKPARPAHQSPDEASTASPVEQEA